MITNGFLNSQNMIRIFKQSGHDFSGKRLCNGYFVKMCDVYVWRPMFKRHMVL